MTMAHSLEGRSPFLDHELASWAARLPARFKIAGRTQKAILRRAFAAELPPRILERGKQGFGIPLGTWLRTDLASWSEEVLLGEGASLHDLLQRDRIADLLAEHRRGRIDHGKRIWALLCLQRWITKVAGR
jgi:asparagine synthase (glutamine-hydrolysing)